MRASTTAESSTCSTTSAVPASAGSGSQLTRAGSEVPMVREEREKAASWGISAAVHLVILLLVTATGLFQAVSSESHPVDVEIYDNVTEDEQSSDGGEAAEEQPAAAEAAAMEAPAMAPIVIDESLKAPEIEKEPKEPKEPQEMKDAKDEKPEKKAEAKPASDKPANPSAAAKPDAKAANGAPGGGDGGRSDKPQGGPARDPSRVKRVKVRAAQLSTAQPAYPVSLQAKKAVRHRQLHHQCLRRCREPAD